MLQLTQMGYQFIAITCALQLNSPVLLHAVRLGARCGSQLTPGHSLRPHAQREGCGCAQQPQLPAALRSRAPQRPA